MKLAFTVNDLATEQAIYTTTRLGLAAMKMDHEPWIIGVGEFYQDSDNRLCAMAHQAPKKRYQTLETYLEALQAAPAERIYVDELDVLMLRNDPAEDLGNRPWAQSAGIVFGQLAASQGPIVLNHPSSLAEAINKMYFQHFPTAIRPKSLISRNVEDIKRFHKENDEHIVLKPLQGSGGQSVFLVKPDDAANLNQMVEAIVRDGYVIAQEYLPAAKDGDVRMFLMNGKPLQKDGQYAAFRRVNSSGDMRSNMHVGGKSQKTEVTDEMLRLAEIVRPKLIADGMFLVGLDIVGDKLMEINVFSPGGLGSSQKLTEIDFGAIVIEDLERKVFYKEHYGRGLDNRTLATL